jgi:peptide/nickel transport system substrate-binding protein
MNVRRLRTRALQRWTVVAAALAALVCLLAACSSSPVTVSGGSSKQSSLTVVEVNQTWPNLDPATDPVSGLDVNYFDAIYGQLFEQLPNGSIQGDLAQGYSYSSDYKTLTITLRPGVTFQDGTPFNAAAVVWNLQRDFNPKTACSCLGNFAVVTSVAAQGDSKVVLTLSQPYAPLLQSFIGQAPNWIMSPTAFTKMGQTAFDQAPVGAGPFQVQKNVASSTLTLTKFPKYWEPGKPSLQKLTFITTPNDQSAYAALQSGQAQLVLGITTQQIINEAKSGFQVLVTPGTQAQDLVFNTKKAPFNNQTAREAVAYAIDSAQLLNVVSPGFGVTMQAPGGPGSLYYEKTVPGFRSYDLAKAKQLVQQLGGLSIVLTHSTNTAVFATLAPAVGNQLTAAGIKVSYATTTPAQAVQIYSSGNFEVNPSNAGAMDPDVGANGLPTRLGSKGEFSCCADPTLDGLIDQSLTTVNATARSQVFAQIYQYISDKQYIVPIFSLPTALEAAKGLSGLTATSNGNAATEMVQWENVAWSSS